MKESVCIVNFLLKNIFTKTTIEFACSDGKSAIRKHPKVDLLIIWEEDKPMKKLEIKEIMMDYQEAMK